MALREEHRVVKPCWMLVRLGDETRQYHPRADADRLALMDVSSLDEYRELLVRVYGFEAAVELAVAEVPRIDLRAFGGRTRTSHLHDDLLALGIDAIDVAALPRYMPRAIHTPAQALGWSFVIERSSLLSGLIQRHLARRLPAATASAYLSGNGHPPGERFRAFGDMLGAQVRAATATAEAIVEAAIEAFRAQHQWYTRRARARSVPPAMQPRALHSQTQQAPMLLASEPRDAA